MAELLDDHKFEVKPEKPEPNPIVGYIGFVLFIALIGFQFWYGAISETALVLGSYVWMPFLAMWIFGFIFPPKKAILLSVLTLPVIFVFYQTIWSAL